ncbi:SusD/RagB family nutrient-binding outer membrane lipoprotein [Hanstruepera ponticola]|uniref:SusD/RagB family nutrient-binding outer membrane lipoprotein n=1 Tax=Hanstruepera ponticola TaxID=2042995 RepID=UPI000CF12B4F|nr:SusD/RagB family nutrient-binding outer membrane lipoprotein [Hanstruepera ponticola]
MKRYLIYFNLILVALLISSCSDSYLDVNTDTNSPTGENVGPDLRLSPAQVITANSIQGNRRTNHLGNMFMYNWSQSDGFAWYPDEFAYNVSSSFYQQIWNDAYLGALQNYRQLQDFEGPDYVNYIAIAKIMESFHFQILVDLYGDIPYSEALQRGANPTPKYDDAQAVYEGIVATLNEAMNMIDNATGAAIVPGADDFIFGGNMQDWKVFANTIKLRALVRQSDVAGREGYLQEQFAGMDAIGFISSNVTVQPGYVQEANRQNPFWNTFGADTGGVITNTNNATCATDFILQYLSDKSDPRLNFLFEEPASGHLGVPQGVLNYPEVIWEPQFVSNIGPGLLKGFDQDAVIFSLAESNFNIAEARLKNYLSGSAQAAYESGIQAAFDYLGAGSAAAYYTQPLENVNWANSDPMEAIITQKWLALIGVDAVQSWFDYSRTGYPTNLPISMQATTADRPVRLFYTSGEQTSNNANVPPQPNAFTGKIFWAN